MVVNEKTAGDAARMLAAFLAPFEESEIKLKPQKVTGNRCLAIAYIDARLVLDRLDEVAGLDGWQDEYTVLPTGEVECRLSVRIAGEWITKADVGGQSEQPDEGDRLKAAYSDALKRAAVKFGIGRFLYRRKQEWLDYDPVKKCVIRPGSQQAQQPVQRRASLADQCEGALEQCRNRADFEDVYLTFKEDDAAGKFTPQERERLLGVFKAVGAKYPKPAAKPAGQLFDNSKPAGALH